MKKISLNGCYRGLGVSPGGTTISFEAAVPGCVHTDLMKNGTLPDLFFGTNAEACRELESWSFEFSRTFAFHGPCENAYLLFEGLDTFCDVYLNGRLVGAAEDMFLEYRFPVGDCLVCGENRLRLRFYSAVKRVENRPETNAVFGSDRIYIRRMQCTFGWDWVNRFVTCGIWKSAGLCIPGQKEIESVHVRTKALDGAGAQVGIDIELSGAGREGSVWIEIFSPQGEKLFEKQKAAAEGMIRETADIREPRLWWINGYGEQPLYKLCVRVLCGGAASEKTVLFGIRTLRVDQLADKEGGDGHRKALALKRAPHLAEADKNEAFSGFTVILNGAPVMCKGANWVPPEPFPSGAEDQKYRELLGLAAEGGFNMLRVWGGGIFENDLFYDECDRLGILVTQDFLMAVAKYPEEEDWFRELIEKEAIQAVKRLRNHPSLAWWTGDNENGGAHGENEANYPGRKIALDTVAPVIERYDGSRLFMPTSPYGGTPNMSATKGTTHTTFFLESIADDIQYGDLKNYKSVLEGYLARFSAEEPTVGAPSYFSLRKFMTEESIFGDDGGAWRYHTRNHPSPRFQAFELYDMNAAFAEKLFGAFTSGRDRLFKMQAVQYEWVRITMENFRRSKPFSSGLLYWMFNDCWPASGWALIDYYCLPKAGYYGFKRGAKGLIASVEKKDGYYRVWLCNDLPETVSCTFRLFLQSAGRAEAPLEWNGAREVPAHAALCGLSVPAGEIDGYLTGGTVLLCELQSDSGGDLAYYIPERPQDVRFGPADIRVTELSKDTVTLIADQFVYLVRLDGAFVFEDNFFPLLPGRKKTVAFRPSYRADDAVIEIDALYQEFQAVLELPRQSGPAAQPTAGGL